MAYGIAANSSGNSPIVWLYDKSRPFRLVWPMGSGLASAAGRADRSGNAVRRSSGGAEAEEGRCRAPGGVGDGWSAPDGPEPRDTGGTALLCVCVCVCVCVCQTGY